MASHLLACHLWGNLIQRQSKVWTGFFTVLAPLKSVENWVFMSQTLLNELASYYNTDSHWDLSF